MFISKTHYYGPIKKLIVCWYQKPVKGLYYIKVSQWGYCYFHFNCIQTGYCITTSHVLYMAPLWVCELFSIATVFSNSCIIYTANGYQ